MAAGLAATRAGGRRRRTSLAAIHRGQLGAGSEIRRESRQFVASGPRSMLVHASWSPRPLEPGDAVFLEVPGVRPPLPRRVHPRRLDPGSRPRTPVDVAEVGAEALAEAKAAMRPGIPAAAVFEAEAWQRIDAGDVGYARGADGSVCALGTRVPAALGRGAAHHQSQPKRAAAPGARHGVHVITTMRPQRLGGAVGMSDHGAH